MFSIALPASGASTASTTILHLVAGLPSASHVRLRLPRVESPLYPLHWHSATTSHSTSPQSPAVRLMFSPTIVSSTGSGSARTAKPSPKLTSSSTAATPEESSLDLWRRWFLVAPEKRLMFPPIAHHSSLRRAPHHHRHRSATTGSTAEVAGLIPCIARLAAATELLMAASEPVVASQRAELLHSLLRSCHVSTLVPFAVEMLNGSICGLTALCGSMPGPQVLSMLAGALTDRVVEMTSDDAASLLAAAAAAPPPIATHMARFYFSTLLTVPVLSLLSREEGTSTWLRVRNLTTALRSALTLLQGNGVEAVTELVRQLTIQLDFATLQLYSAAKLSSEGSKPGAPPGNLNGAIECHAKNAILVALSMHPEMEPRIANAAAVVAGLCQLAEPFCSSGGEANAPKSSVSVLATRQLRRVASGGPADIGWSPSDIETLRGLLRRLRGHSDKPTRNVSYEKRKKAIHTHRSALVAQQQQQQQQQQLTPQRRLSLLINATAARIGDCDAGHLMREKSDAVAMVKRFLVSIDLWRDEEVGPQVRRRALGALSKWLLHGVSEAAFLNGRDFGVKCASAADPTLARLVALRTVRAAMSSKHCIAPPAAELLAQTLHTLETEEVLCFSRTLQQLQREAKPLAGIGHLFAVELHRRMTTADEKRAKGGVSASSLATAIRLMALSSASSCDGLSNSAAALIETAVAGVQQRPPTTEGPSNAALGPSGADQWQSMELLGLVPENESVLIASSLTRANQRRHKLVADLRRWHLATCDPSVDGVTLKTSAPLEGNSRQLLALFAEGAVPGGFGGSVLQWWTCTGGPPDLLRLRWQALNMLNETSAPHHPAGALFADRLKPVDYAVARARTVARARSAALRELAGSGVVETRDTSSDLSTAYRDVLLDSILMMK